MTWLMLFFCLIEPEAIPPDVPIFQTSPDGNVTVSTLVFIPTIKDAGKFVGCRAADMLTGEGSLEDGWELAITCKENSQNMARYERKIPRNKNRFNARISRHVNAEEL